VASFASTGGSTFAIDAADEVQRTTLDLVKGAAAPCCAEKIVAAAAAGHRHR